MKKKHFYILVCLLHFSVGVYSQTIKGDTVQYIDLSKSHNPSDKEVVYIIKVEKQYYYFEIIGPEIVRTEEIRKGKFLSESTWKVKLDSKEAGVLILVKRKYFQIVKERINKSKTRPNTR